MASSEESDKNLSGVAIVGMAGRFPGCGDIDSFWQALREGTETISVLTDEELRALGIEPALLDNPSYVKAKGVLEDADLFDAAFFGLSPREAEVTDPQHRVFLETAWTALEHAGYNPETYPGTIGVYAGAGWTSYLLFNLATHPKLLEPGVGHQTLLGNDKDNLATRVSYKLNLKGPSLTIQTGCSTSLVATVMGYHALLSYQCDMALAGGVSISVPQGGYLHQTGSIFSPDGHCRAFDARAQGTVIGSGAGVVILKRLEDALADRDRIYAVIRGAAVNNDGALKAGYTAPSIEGQARAILEAHATADIEARSITYVEAHGTGTTLGDPIEVAALTQAFRASTGEKSFCALGSVKTNIGHLDAAAGIAGLIKTVLALQHRQLPPSLHFENPNPQIDFANTPFYVNTSLSEWKAHETPRRAGVSAFGLGGTNAHVLLEESPPRPGTGTTATAKLLVLSARSPDALEKATTNLAHHLEQHRELELADVAFTLQTGRKAFAHRRVLVSDGLDDAVAALTTRPAARVFTRHTEQDERGVVFLFSGQGTQYVHMARGLYESEPTFRHHADICFEHLRTRHGLELRELLYPSEQQRGPSAERLKQTENAQPALFVIEYALARMWMAWGVPMQASIGHSLGEYVAATLAGVFSLEDALTLVAARGRLMQACPPGAMLAVPLSEQELLPLLGPSLSLASINGPRSCVASGPFEAIESLHRELTAREIDSRYLETSHAFHSAMMDSALEPFAEHFRHVQLHAPRTPFLSNVTGTWMTPADATDPRYWVKHLRQTVRFADGLNALLEDAQSVLLEVGPGRVLSQLARKHPAWSAARTVLHSLPSAQDGACASRSVLETLGQLWLSGVDIDWAGVHGSSHPHRVPLPTYPFERQRYWIEPASRDSTTAPRRQALHGERLRRQLAEAAQAQAREELAGFDEQKHRLDNESLDEASLAYMNLALRRLGAFRHSDEALTREELLARCQILPRYEQLLSRWLEVLVEARQLQRDDAGRYRALRPCTEESVVPLLANAQARWSHTPQVVDLVRQCGDALKDVLRGEQTPAELFSFVLEGSSEKPQTEFGLHTHYTTILRRGVESLAKSLPSSTKLRVLEIGGGTGIATATLLPLLPADRTEYTFTDLTALFLKQAERKFSAYPFVKYEPLDIERPPEEQGHPRQAFDVIVAVNVLHAVRDIHVALEHVRSLLAPGGVVLIAELTRPTPDFAITYSLMMNPVEDPERDQGNPFLTPTQWCSVLEANGFVNAIAVPGVDTLGQHVLMAHAPEASPLAAQSEENQAVCPAFTCPVPSAAPKAEQAPTTGLTKKADIADWFSVPSWKRSSRRPIPDGAREESTPEHWLLFVNGDRERHLLAERLERRGQHVVTVKAGAGFRQDGPNQFTLDAEHPDDYDALLRELQAQGLRPSAIVHAWSLSRPEEDELTLASVEEARKLGLDSVLHLARSFGSLGMTDPVRLWMVTNDMQDVLGEEISPAKALLLAPCKVIPLEYPNIQCFSVDISLASRGPRDGEPLEQLMEELRSGSSDPVVAYRHGHRWVRTTEPVRMEQAPASASPLKQGGTYLITGGLGKVGLTLADYLARTYQARLVLLQRTPLPAPGEWDAWLRSHPTEDPTSRLLRNVRELEARGSEVMVLSADVSHLEQMRAAVARATTRFGRIDGVIHSAGVLGDGGIQHKTQPELLRVLAPKVTGTLVLDTIFKDNPPDFLVLFSSLSSLEPGFGQVAYSAANNFLDAFVSSRAARRYPHVACINWDVWRGEGMAYDAKAPRALQKLKEEDFRQRGILPEEGVEVFRRVMGCRLPQVLVSTSNYLDMLKQEGRDLSQLYIETLRETNASMPGHARPQLGNAYEPPEGETEKTLADIWQELLGIQGIGATDNFFDLGGDSLIGTQLLSRVRKSFGVKLSTKSIYGHPTIRSLSSAIDEALVGEVSAEKLTEVLKNLDRKE
ncbi:Malonyl CoA-acyl carrier protein transacylase [Cystobacter fuscus DSM 2262]|uniref:Phenolphthiocerol/phthiocerol polyketide synthase subunit E n=1 Tax=Cystobacter fuscus (strain ATCC 25194 / DSM 2262 / NBRC 100088 / M29) TaxID=1242864 RepID=S9QCF5_CYSF2|nr:type I polyketide synthase [Cystobacter fuscus]EPX59034.1 Malonyl CoA-acyl carrier protein transacylase [Cystobacter fuscus DSM 2262]